MDYSLVYSLKPRGQLVRCRLKFVAEGDVGIGTESVAKTNGLNEFAEKAEDRLCWNPKLVNLEMADICDRLLGVVGLPI